MSHQPDPSLAENGGSDLSNTAGSTPVRTPPVAERRPHSFTHHGVTIDDPWYWLRDSSYPAVDDADVLAYLAAENEYFEATMSPHRELIETIFEEIKARQQPDLSSVPVEARRVVLPVELPGRQPVPRVATLAGRRSQRAGRADCRRRDDIGRAGVGSCRPTISAWARCQ